MKYLIKNTVQRFLIVSLLFWLAGFCGFFIPVPAICDTSVADSIISLNVTGRPLGDVLENISVAADCQFSIDESWENYPVTAFFDNEPLYRGLNLILRNINNAVIYGADRTIKIIIYDEGTPSGKEIRHSVTIKYPQETIQQLQLSSEATAPQPEVEVSEDISDAENVGQQFEETAESAAETNEADAEKTETTEEENIQTEETDASSGDLEDSEIMENSEKSSEN